MASDDESNPIIADVALSLAREIDTASESKTAAAGKGCSSRAKDAYRRFWTARVWVALGILVVIGLATLRVVQVGRGSPTAVVHSLGALISEADFFHIKESVSDVQCIVDIAQTIYRAANFATGVAASRGNCAGPPHQTDYPEDCAAAIFGMLGHLAGVAARLSSAISACPHKVDVQAKCTATAAGLLKGLFGTFNTVTDIGHRCMEVTADDDEVNRRLSEIYPVPVHLSPRELIAEARRLIASSPALEAGGSLTVDVNLTEPDAVMNFLQNPPQQLKDGPTKEEIDLRRTQCFIDTGMCATYLMRLGVAVLDMTIYCDVFDPYNNESKGEEGKKNCAVSAFATVNSVAKTAQHLVKSMIFCHITVPPYALEAQCAERITSLVAGITGVTVQSMTLSDRCKDAGDITTRR